MGMMYTSTPLPPSAAAICCRSATSLGSAAPLLAPPVPATIASCSSATTARGKTRCRRGCAGAVNFLKGCGDTCFERTHRLKASLMHAYARFDDHGQIVHEPGMHAGVDGTRGCRDASVAPLGRKGRHGRRWVTQTEEDL